jgi:hypothetical protein
MTTSAKIRADLEALARMTIEERVAYIKAFEALTAATALEPSYESVLAIREASRLVVKVRLMMAEALRRPTPVDGRRP